MRARLGRSGVPKGFQVTTRSGANYLSNTNTSIYVSLTHDGWHDHSEVGPDVAPKLGRGRVDQFVDEVLGVCERGLVLGQHASVDVHNDNLVFPQQFLEVERKQSLRHCHLPLMWGREDCSLNGTENEVDN